MYNKKSTKTLNTNVENKQHIYSERLGGNSIEVYSSLTSNNCEYTKDSRDVAPYHFQQKDCCSISQNRNGGRSGLLNII